MRLAPLLLFALAPVSAVAAGRGEMTAAAGPALGLFHQSDTRASAGVDARIIYGLTDAWSAHATLAADLVPAAKGLPTTAVVAPLLGLTAAADAVNWVPFAEASVGLADVRTADASQQRLGAALGAGADYLVSRHVGVTVYGRAAWWPLRVAGPDGPAPLQVVVAILLARAF
jgi:hypothetical protein